MKPGPDFWIDRIGAHTPAWSEAFMAAAQRQLWESADAESGLPGFTRYKLFALLGVHPPNLSVATREGIQQGEASIHIVVPPSFTFPARIAWRIPTGDMDARSLHHALLAAPTGETLPEGLRFHWADPLDRYAMEPFLKPVRRRKLQGRDAAFRVEEMAWSFPDVVLEFRLKEAVAMPSTLERANACVEAFKAEPFPAGCGSDWFVSVPSLQEDGQMLVVVLDAGHPTKPSAATKHLDQLCIRLAEAIGGDRIQSIRYTG
jgi:hypothetical protein